MKNIIDGIHENINFIIKKKMIQIIMYIQQQDQFILQKYMIDIIK